MSQWLQPQDQVSNSQGMFKIGLISEWPKHLLKVKYFMIILEFSKLLLSILNHQTVWWLLDCLWLFGYLEQPNHATHFQIWSNDEMLYLVATWCFTWIKKIQLCSIVVETAFLRLSWSVPLIMRTYSHTLRPRIQKANYRPAWLQLEERFQLSKVNFVVRPLIRIGKRNAKHAGGSLTSCLTYRNYQLLEFWKLAETITLASKLMSTECLSTAGGWQSTRWLVMLSPTSATFFRSGDGRTT